MAFVTSYWSLYGLIVLIIIIVAAYNFMTRKFNYWKERGVSEIKPLPFFGNFMDIVFLKKAPGIALKELYNKSKGKPYVGLFMFDKPVLLIRDQEIIKDILIKDFNYFDNRSSNSSGLARDSILFLRNPMWKIVRAKLTPFFSSGKLRRLFDLLMDCTVNLDNYLDLLKLDEKETMIDVKDLFGNLTTDMIGSTAFGLNFDSVNNPNCEFREKTRMMFECNILRGLELFLVFFYAEVSRLIGATFFGKENTDYLRKVFWNTINRRIKSGERRGDLIDMLINFKREYANQDFGDFQVDGDGLVAQAAIFLSGGFETSSSAMSFTLYEIAIQPQIQDRLRKEIIDTLEANDGKITYEMILSMPYLHMVISETVRMYPILAILDREATETYKVANSDLIIEKGMPVYISLFGIHYDPEFFPNPEKFDPERYSKENIHKIPPCAYMPFGEGPRKCIGTRLGLLQTKLGLIKFLNQYEVTPCEKTIIPMIIDPKNSVTSPLTGKIWLNVRKIKTFSN